MSDQQLARRMVQLPNTREATAQRLRRFRRVKNQLLTDRGGDPTQAQAILAHNAAALAIWLEEQSQEMMQGAEKDLSQINGSMNTLRRLLETLGIERQPRDVTTLSQYLDQNAVRANGHSSSN